jgi:hypothetical protein
VLKSLVGSWHVVVHGPKQHSSVPSGDLRAALANATQLPEDDPWINEIVA